MTLHGLGIGWRPEVSGIIAQLDGLAFCEVIAESVGNEIPPHLGSLGVPVIPHGISLSLGGADAVDQARIDHLARASQLLGAPLASEHIAFVRAGGIEAGHLLPLPRTYEAVDAWYATSPGLRTVYRCRSPSKTLPPCSTGRTTS